MSRYKSGIETENGSDICLRRKKEIENLSAQQSEDITGKNILKSDAAGESSQCSDTQCSGQCTPNSKDKSYRTEIGIIKKKSSKNIIISISAAILICIVLAVLICFYLNEKRLDEIKITNTESITAADKNLEYGSTLTYDDIMASVLDYSSVYPETSVTIYLNNEIISGNVQFNSIGANDIRIVLQNESITIEKSAVWTVEDTQFPTISGISDKEITQGDAIDICSGISASDPVDGNLETVIDENADINTPGGYTVKVSAKDKNGNETIEEFTVTVKEKPAPLPEPEEKNPADENTIGSSDESSGSNTSSMENNIPLGEDNGQTEETGSANSGPSSVPDTSSKEGRRKLALAEAKRVVSSVITGDMDSLTKATVLCEYLNSTAEIQTNQSNDAYKTNYGNEAYAALIMKKAACSGFCKAYVMLCEEAGLEVQHINAGKWTHQWCLVNIDGDWRLFDPQGGVFNAPSDFYDWMFQ